jgi:TrmH family RNA methyltransferase
MTVPSQIRPIESRHNPRLKELRRAFAAPGGHTDGLIGIEGPNLIQEALRAGLAFSSLFVAQESPRFLDEIEDGLADGLTLPPSVEIFSVPRELLSAALSTESPQPIAALIAPPAWTWQDLLQNEQKIIVLAGLQDPGNLGTILRSAEAFGASGIVSLPGTVSPWNPKAVRASAGSVFRLPFISASPEEAFAKLRAARVRIWTTALDNATPAPAAALYEPFAFLIGNEGNGVPAELAAQADATLTIPCPGPVESLNAAVAASILLYEASRQRAAAKPAAKKGRAR